VSNKGISKRSYFSAKYGPRAETFLAKVEATGEPLGITFDWEGTSGSTYDSQILVLAAEKWEVQSRLLDLLFKGHLEERRDIADRGFLVECAIEAGLVGSEKEGLRLLDDEGLGRRVEEANTMARARGVVAVPSYLVQGRWFVGGTQRCEIFLDLFRRVAGETGDGRVILVSAGKRRP
jgi:predicted DsbA family dithiol-disulfide isomerase